MDPISPVAPARICALLLPVGHIKKSRFSSFVARLKHESITRLGDISPDSRPGKNMFSPLAYPDGVILYNMTTAPPLPTHIGLSPFEAFRAPFLVLCIADGAELQLDALDNHDEQTKHRDTPRQILELYNHMKDISEDFSSALVSQLLIFDCPIGITQHQLPQDVIRVPSPSQSRSTTVKTIMCDISALMLAEMTTMYASIQERPQIDSPGVAGALKPMDNDSSTWNNSNTRTSRPSTPSIAGADAPLNSTSGLSIHAKSSILNYPRPSSPDPFSTTTASENDTDSRESTEDSVRRRPKSAFWRDSSRDSKTPQLQSVSATERARNKLKARQGIILGSLFLLAGRWPDAIRELIDSTTRAKAFSDHLWHAKGLENILVTLLLLGWAGSDFQIPKIILPMGEKPFFNAQNSVQAPNALTNTNNSLDATPTPSLQRLAPLIPDLVSTILNTYARAGNFQGEALPQFPLAECVIRLTHLLSIIHRLGGALHRAAMRSIVLGSPLPPLPPSLSFFAPNWPGKRDISVLIFRAYPSTIEISSTPIHDTVIIFSGIASVLAVLGLRRKRAIVVKELLTMLIPSLIQARKVGAAEVGIHPAAGLAAFYGLATDSNRGRIKSSDDEEVENSFKGLLDSLCRTFGVFGLSYDVKKPESTSSGDRTVIIEDLSRRAIGDAKLRSFGGIHLKIDILRLCTNFSEALPNFPDVIQYTNTLLRLTGPGSAPSERNAAGSVLLVRDEQIRLATKLKRTLGMFKAVDLPRMEAQYWDDFLIRGMAFSEPSDQKRLVPFSSTELSGISQLPGAPNESLQGPFIHNPFLKSLNQSVEDVLIVNELSEFVVLLQNLYHFELVVEKIIVVTEGAGFVPTSQSVVIGPFRTQRVLLSGKALDPGQLRVIGCAVKIQGCRENLFLNFPDAWSAKVDARLKQNGPFSIMDSRPLSSASRQSSDSQTGQDSTPSPAPKELSFTIIKEQPFLVVTSTTLPQAIMNVMEGENKQFSITVRNTSNTTPVNFVHVSFKHTPRTSLQPYLRGSVNAFDLHEADYLAIHRQPFKWQRPSDSPIIDIAPGAEMSFDFEVFGRTGLSEGLVQIDYASLDQPGADIKEKIYTRRVQMVLKVTVNASARLQRLDVIPVGDIPFRNTINSPASTIKNSSALQALLNKHRAPVLDRVIYEDFSKDNFILLLDVRNAWPWPLMISANLKRNDIKDTNGNNNKDVANYIAEDLVQPGHITRLALPIPRIFVDAPYKPIPILSQSTQRQFVYDATQTPESGRASCEAFWFREGLLDNVEAFWRDLETESSGIIDLRGIRLNSRMIDIVRCDSLGIELCITRNSKINTESIGNTRSMLYSAQTNEYLEVKALITNRTSYALQPLLTFCPKLKKEPKHTIADLTKRVAWTGLTRRPLRKIQPSQTFEVSLGLCFLSPGCYEVSAIAEDIRVSLNAKDKQHKLLSDAPNGQADTYSRIARLGVAACSVIVQ